MLIPAHELHSRAACLKKLISHQTPIDLHNVAHVVTKGIHPKIQLLKFCLRYLEELRVSDIPNDILFYDGRRWMATIYSRQH